MRPFAAIVLIFTLVVPSLSFSADQTALVGYSPRSSQSEREGETKFRAIPDPANLREYMRRLSARPHHVGSPYDKDNAEWILAHFKEWGLDAHIERFDVLFPTRPMRPADGVQRGSVMDFASASPGDPLTPGIGATPDAKRLSLKEAKSITKIPVLPISYGDAQPLLAALAGPMAPDAWRGSLPIPYHVGPGPARVHLKVAFNWDTKPVYDVIAKIPGSVAPDEWIVRGNHHDAWVNGAEDPISGQVSLLEEARALGLLLKQGWQPRRTIIYCAWDGEEPMLLGSTEWVETHADELREHAAVYVNTDGNDRGVLNMNGSHSLEQFINGVAREIEDPETKMTVWQRAQLNKIAEAKSADERKEFRQRADLRIEALGSGTDFTAFLDHLGIATLDMAYGGEDEQGIYHSIYDDFYWYTHFSDTDFVYGRALAQTVGTSVMRLADAEVLPFDFVNFADTVETYTKNLEKLLADKQEEIRERNQELDEGMFKATFDPRRPTVAPMKDEIPPHLNFAPMHNAVDSLTRSAKHYHEALTKQQASSGEDAMAAKLGDLNRELIESERRLTNADGLPRRPWYKHLLYAPGVYTGYAVKTVPGVREGIEQKRYAEAEQEIVRVAKALEDEAALIESAARELEGAGR